MLALVLSLASAVSLGITRFAYGLLLPPMRDDLSWSYALAGSMNTANAVGYLLGALSAPWLMRRWGASKILLGGAVLAALFMAASGFFLNAWPLLLQRLFAGVASAWVFVAAGVLAARLGTWYPQRSGLLLGIVYGGVGWGIVIAALAVPLILSAYSSQLHAWTWAWWWLALPCVLAACALWWPAKWFIDQEIKERKSNRIQTTAIKVDSIEHTSDGGTTPVPLPVQVPTFTPSVPLKRFGFALSAYACFGIGYIGYMTFVIALLRDRGVKADDLTLFYALLGAAVVISSRLWAGLLDKAKAGGALAFLNALLGVAVVLPAVTEQWALMLLSGVLFGAVFLSVVASTTALVRHNLPATQWTAGISAFTIIFALGQILGPAMVGWIADGKGSLAQGLLVSAIVLWIGAGLAWLQRAVGVVKD
jgi:predicted MFS family arabinose efflux permease